MHEAVASLAVHTGAKTQALGGPGVTQPDPGEGKATVTPSGPRACSHCLSLPSPCASTPCLLSCPFCEHKGAWPHAQDLLKPRDWPAGRCGHPAEWSPRPKGEARPQGAWLRNLRLSPPPRGRPDTRPGPCPPRNRRAGAAGVAAARGHRAGGLLGRGTRAGPRVKEAQRRPHWPGG